MPEATTTAQQQRTAEAAGFFEHSRGLLAALTNYLSARLRLAGIESKEAFVHFGIIIGLAVAALMVVFLGYIFLCVGLVVLLAHLLHMRAEWAILALALLHFGVAIVCLLIARTRLAVPMFTATLGEFKKDTQWLDTSKQS
jgi:uncharacterized membrane protein YqjE